MVADLDLNEKKEIIIGYEGSAGLFIYNYDGSKYRGISGAFYVPQEWQNLIGMDCRPVVAELDHSDVNPEIILLSAYSDKKAHIFALNHDQSEVTNWTYDQTNHIIDISSTDNGNYPALTVADLDFDGIIEVIIADAGKVYAWKATGEYFNGHFPIEVEGLECPYVAPLVANVDKDPESEIIIADPVNNFIYAFNLDGSQVPGWPLAVDGLMATPAIGDVNHDGLNEIVAVYGGYVNVWKTDGETGHDQWPLYRLNSFNNAVYEEPACTYDPNDPWTIDPEVDPLVWDDYKVLTRDIIIPEDVTLTITGRVAMPDDSKIIVQRGGRLVVDGGIITSACGGLWQGIQVWGYKDKSQYDLNFPPGKVELSGNAVIENARIGVATVKSVNGAVDENYTGGELLCREATFLNNIYGIRFYNYRNFDPYNPPHNELDYASYISNSTFITNGHLAENGASPVAFIRMDDVVGIRLSGNQFMNTSGEEYNWNSRGNGIESYNAAYFMHGLCLDGNPPCSLFKKNYFYNLSYGIKSHGQGRENRSITVLNSDFHLNQKGMFVSCINNANINFNTFTVPEKSTGNEIPRYGLYLEICSGYTIEENSFQGWGDGLDENIGMYINNSGSEPNEVYKNDFSDLAYGIVAYGQNRNETGEGLCLKCNNFDLCMNDIHVIPEKGPPHGLWLQGRNQGIAQNQGNGSSLTSLAGNTFSFGDPPVFNYFNHDYCNNITYNYHGENETDYKISPDPYSPEPLVDPKPAFGYTFESKDAACPSNYGGGGINLSLEKSVVSSEKGLVTLYSDSIQTFLDGGDTYALNFEVVTSLPDEAYQIRQQLLDESPYLSDTVMKSAIYKENVLPNAMIRDVLVANPQSAKSSEIIERVNERIEPMPEEMMYDILEGRNIKGNLEILEGKLASHMTFKYESLHKLELYYKLDTIDILGSQDSLIALWSMENDPEILYKLAFLYLNKHDSTNCFNTLNSIPQSSTLTDKQMLEYDDYSLLLEILWNLNHNTTNLDSTLVGPLSELMSHNSKPGYLARNVLIANGIIEYIEPIYLAYELKSVFVNPNKSGDTKSYKSNLIVFPNPAKNYIIVSYDLKERQGKSSISISSIDGKPCYQEYLNGIKNQTIISLSGFSSGVYCIQLKNNGEIIGTVKFVISK
ncbi:MAG: T9SS type A sorting domain-containing protein [Bacteroidales bacterium]